MPSTNSTKQKIALPTATWSISLFCDCPGCLESTDLLDLADFWDGGQPYQIGEHHTVQTIDVEVICPACGHTYSVNFDY